MIPDFFYRVGLLLTMGLEKTPCTSGFIGKYLCHTSPVSMECMRYGKSVLHLSIIIFIYYDIKCWYQFIGMLVSQIFCSLFHNNNNHCIPSNIFS